jgi:hypothetical protein
MYAGADNFADDFNPHRIWAPPNLTPAQNTGRLTHMSEDEFVARFHAGRAIPGSPMPWEQFARMSDDDLRGIYRFLRTLPPVENDVGPPFVDKK